MCVREPSSPCVWTQAERYSFFARLNLVVGALTACILYFVEQWYDVKHVYVLELLQQGQLLSPTQIAWGPRATNLVTQHLKN